MSVLKISKTCVFYIRTSDEYLTSYEKRSVLTDPYPNLVKYAHDVLKKNKKVLDIINTNKTCFIKINVKSSPQEIS
jgi:hypothetical protein